MRRDEIDIFISGAGPAGLIAAAALAAPGRRIVVADPGPDPALAGGRGDLRSTAFLRPARDLFERIGLWSHLEPLSTPLEALRIVDLAGDPPSIRTERSFCGDPGAALGWNFMNDVLRDALLTYLRGQSGVELVWGAGFAALLNRTSAALVTLTNGRQLQARLVVAADGRSSPLREAAGIGVKTTRYGQKALAFAVAHEIPHSNVSTELYLSGGPFTMVPLPDRDGSPASAVVWMNPGTEAARLLALGTEAFEAAATTRSAGVLGRLRLLTGRSSFPVISQKAERFAEGRVAIAAEAAHVLPPIGAQGLNTSVADVIQLAHLTKTAADPGSPHLLAAYDRARQADLPQRARAIDLYNRLTRSPDPISQFLRAQGLGLLHDIAPIREGLIKSGMGPAPQS